MNKLPARNVTSLPSKAIEIPYAAFDNYWSELKHLSEASRDIRKAASDVYAHCPSSQLESGERQLARCERIKRDIEELYEKRDQLDPEEAYDDDGNILRATVALHVSMLVGSFPNANPSDPKVYVGMLIKEVTAKPFITVTLLEAAFRSLRRSARFLPTISEVLSELEQEDVYDERMDNLIGFDAVVDKLRKNLQAEKSRREEAKKQQTSPFCEGDRVNHLKFGNGTVVAVDGEKVNVLFDHLQQEKRVVASFLTKLEGDPCASDK